jgi:hypothetical protein
MRRPGFNFAFKFSLRRYTQEAIRALSGAGKRDKMLNLLEGCEPVMRDLLRWLNTIIEDPTARLFVAGDGGAGRATDFVPEVGRCRLTVSTSVLKAPTSTFSAMGLLYD